MQTGARLLKRAVGITLVGGTCFSIGAYADGAVGLGIPTFTVAQAERGKAAFDQSCASCHGAHLDDGALGKPLRGIPFLQHYAGKGLDQLWTTMVGTMPMQQPGSLAKSTYADILAYILGANGMKPGDKELQPNVQGLAHVAIPAPEFMGFSPFAPKLPVRPMADPFRHWTPVSARLLANPPARDWLLWRRTQDVHAFSPLRQITARNVDKLQVAWSWSLPPGPALAAPLVHDGVLFVTASSDTVDALNAETGEVIWQYARATPSSYAFNLKRAIALFGDRLYLATSDTHVIALDVKTGHQVWDQQIGDPAARESISGGPIVAEGKVIVGTTGTGVGAKAPQIVALDADTGAIAWRLNTVAAPGAPAGDSWNGVPLEKRSGASVWMPGTFDPDTGLVYFGTGNTYDTGPLLHPVNRPGITNDALYTDTTLALDPKTGRIVWHYQHLPNDQWDLDWAFERQIIRQPVNGVMRDVVLSAGKAAIYDGLDARTGQYLYSIDMGLQNVVRSIDPVTGAKSIDPDRYPDGTNKLICPDAAGAKSFMTGAYDATSHVLFVPLVEACMDMYPAPDGAGGLTSGVTLGVRPRPGSDGDYGRIAAVDVKTRKMLWTVRQRAPQTSGLLATMGGVVFGASLDRNFRALDAATGKLLWEARLNDVSSSSPITYEVNGEQYVAIVTGRGLFQAVSYMPLVPELHYPQEHAATLWVFRLPKSVSASEP